MVALGAVVVVVVVVVVAGRAVARRRAVAAHLLGREGALVALGVAVAAAVAHHSCRTSAL